LPSALGRFTGDLIMQVWDGLTPKRLDLSTAKATGHEDFLVIVQKIRELQEFTNRLASNMDVMPDLDGLLAAAKDKITKLQSSLDALTLPEDIKNRLLKLEQDVLDVDQRAESLRLRRDFEALKEQMSRNQIELLNSHNSFSTEVKGFQSKVWGSLQSLKKETEVKLAELSDQVQQLSTKVELSATLEKFNKLNKQ
jgi:hypothetical protein